jgi:putative membrane protein
MTGFLLHWFITALALGVAAWLLPGVHVQSLLALLFAALILGLVNAIVRPVLVFLTLPITVLTLGIFYLIVNGVAFALAAGISPGFTIDGFWWAVLGALVMSLVSWFVGTFTD